MTERAAIATDVSCPLCGYNLRGLIEPRCPECGYRFQWAELLDRDRNRHPYLFEHHPRRNLRSFLRTWMAALLPRRFWRTLQPTHALRPRRLVLYWFVVATLVVLSPAVGIGREYARGLMTTRDRRANMRAYLKDNPRGGFYGAQLRGYGSAEALIDAYHPWFTWDALRHQYYYHRGQWGRSSVNVLLAALAWPWLTLATLMIFRASMRQASVRSGHVLRCTVYSCDWAPWLSAVVLWFMTPAAVEQHFPWFYPPASMPMLAATAFAAYTSYRLGTAYSRYLRFDRPFATVAAAQLIVFLLVTAVFVLAWGT